MLQTWETYGNEKRGDTGERRGDQSEVRWDTQTSAKKEEGKEK